MQRDVEGSFSGVIMSLLANHCLLFHPKQVCRIENKLPLCTVGNLRESLKNESILSCFYEILISDSAMDKFLSMQKEFENHFKEGIRGNISLEEKCQKLNELGLIKKGLKI